MLKFDALTDRKMSNVIRITMLLAMSVCGFVCTQLPAQGAERGQVIFHNCTACHGDDGLGSADYQAPAIAGQGAWYVENQLNKFKQGHRGAHPDDLAGLRMRPLSKTMRTEEDIKAVAAYVESLPSQKHPKTVMDGDPGRGAAYFKPCVACHGADGAGMQALNAPSLRHSQDWYVLKQLQNFKSGIRGRADGDITGAQMSAMIAAIPDDQAMKDVVAYIQKLK